MSEEQTMTDEAAEGIFSEASTAAASGTAPASEKVDQVPEPDKEEPAKKAESPATPPVQAPAPAPVVPAEKSDPAPAVDAKNQKSLIDQAAESLAEMEFNDPASGENAKITASSLEKEYPSITGYTRAVVEKALEMQAERLRTEFNGKLAQALDSDPTISRIRQAEVEESVASLLESVSSGDDGISNAAEIQKAALSASWVKNQPAHIRAMALESNDPRDVRFILERAAADLNIEVKRGATAKAPARNTEQSDNRVLAARTAIRGSGRQSQQTGKMSSPEEQEAEFLRAAQAIREGKPLNG